MGWSVETLRRRSSDGPEFPRQLADLLQPLVVSDTGYPSHERSISVRVRGFKVRHRVKHGIENTFEFEARPRRHSLRNTGTMARKTPSRLDKRREAEAAEALGKTATKATKAAKKKTTKKKAAKKRKTTRSRVKKEVLERRRLVWAIYSSTMKEEAQFPYEERKEAEAKLEQLRAKSKKSYFIQPMKVPITKEDEGEEVAEAATEATPEAKAPEAKTSAE